MNNVPDSRKDDSQCRGHPYICLRFRKREDRSRHDQHAVENNPGYKYFAMAPAKADQVLVCVIRVRSIPLLPAGQPPAKCDGGINHEGRNDNERHPYRETAAKRCRQRKAASTPSQQQRSRVAEKNACRGAIPEKKAQRSACCNRGQPESRGFPGQSKSKSKQDKTDRGLG